MNQTDTNKHKELDSLKNNMALSGLWTSSGNFESKLREFAIRYESAREWDDPSVDNAAEMQAIVDDFIAATSRLIMEEVRAGIEKYKIEAAIERLDIQCPEGKCKNCNGKYATLKKLQTQLKQLSEEQQS